MINIPIIILSHYLSTLAGLIGFVPGSSMDSGGAFPLSSMNFWSGHKWGPSDRACSLGSPLSSESPIDPLLCCSAALSSAGYLHCWGLALRAASELAVLILDAALRPCQALPHFQTSHGSCLLLGYLCFPFPQPSQIFLSLGVSMYSYQARQTFWMMTVVIFNFRKARDLFPKVIHC